MAYTLQEHAAVKRVFFYCASCYRQMRVVGANDPPDS